MSLLRNAKGRHLLPLFTSVLRASAYRRTPTGPGLTSEFPHAGWSHAADITTLAPRRRILQHGRRRPKQTRDNDRARSWRAITTPGFISRYITRGAGRILTFTEGNGGICLNVCVTDTRHSSSTCSRSDVCWNRTLKLISVFSSSG